MEHMFNVKLAIKYGLEESIFLQNVYFWVEKNRANNRNFYSGSYWTYNSQEALKEIFPYFSVKKIANIIRELKDKGVLLIGNYNKKVYDKTTWFSLPKNIIDEIKEFNKPDVRSPFHYFHIDIATSYSIRDAIIFNNLFHIWEYVQAHNENLFEEKHWVRMSATCVHEFVPYLSPKQIKTAFQSLVSHNALFVGIYNEDKFDRTNWYSVNPLFVSNYGQSQNPAFMAKGPEVMAQQSPIMAHHSPVMAHVETSVGETETTSRGTKWEEPWDQMGGPIPDITTYKYSFSKEKNSLNYKREEELPIKQGKDGLPIEYEDSKIEMLEKQYTEDLYLLPSAKDEVIKHFEEVKSELSESNSRQVVAIINSFDNEKHINNFIHECAMKEAYFPKCINELPKFLNFMIDTVKSKPRKKLLINSISFLSVAVYNQYFFSKVLDDELNYCRDDDTDLYGVTEFFEDMDEMIDKNGAFE